MSINICKECGKQFEATSARVAYCSDIHYRPCPICGKPVEAKYLSDPARRCEDCKGKSTPKIQIRPAVVKELNAQAEGEDVRTYIGKPLLGFVPGHAYSLEIAWNGFSAYNISAVKDVTEDKVVDLFITLSSKTSIDQNFTAAV